jgi:biotin transport system substrate-specific component
LILGNIILYFIGTTYLWFILNKVGGNELSFITLLKGMAIYFPGDLVKVIIAIPLALKIRERINI